MPPKKSSASRRTASAKKTQQPGARRAPAEFSSLQRKILEAKGLTGAQIGKLAECGIRDRADFAEVGDAETLVQISGIPLASARSVVAWALGSSSVSAVAGSVVVDSGDVVHCVHCKAKQPVDYKSGDLCFSCGKQAEPVFACFWCSASGPGKYCRRCGAEFVPTGEFELAVLLRQDGLPKDQIPAKLKEMDAAQKDQLWGRIRRR